ncbi:MAG: hypothetical protein INQ03_11255 [Candidatus Heimdallarchaeota archaeon]|nr:hypothetical protein [Candidatus Heimdallarchaeota archaeon]
MKIWFVRLLLVILVMQGLQVAKGYEIIETNFELYYYTESGIRETESYALYIKQALAPLGIEVRIFAKPWGQFVSELPHTTTGRPFDLAHVRYSDQILMQSRIDHAKLSSNSIPEFSWQYASNHYFGSKVLQLGDPDWQLWQEEDIGYTTEEIDEMISDFDSESDYHQKLTKFEHFNDFYFENLLYDLPLVTKDFHIAMWKGYGGSNNENWEPQEGVVNSRALGARWESNEVGRESNSTHLRFSVSTPQNYILDPYQAIDNAQDDLARYTHTTLISFDQFNNPHPNLAWNYFQTEDGTYDDDNNKNTAEIPLMRFTFLLGNQANWSATTDYKGNSIAAEPLDAEDFVLAFDVLRTFIDSDDFELSFEDDFTGIVDYNASTTINNLDTFNVWYDSRYATPDDYIKFGSVQPLPHHILGGPLHYMNEFNSIIESPLEVGMSFNPWASEEWNHWETLEGVSHVGPYEMVTMKEEESYSFRAREDFWYPNEWDIDNYYDRNNVEIQALETHTNISLDIFAPFNNYSQDAYYWAFAGSEIDHIKPTSQGIETIDHIIIEDINAQLVQFEAGAIDVIQSTQLGTEQVEAHIDDSRFILKTVVPAIGPELLIFNLLNDHLQKIYVRKAISFALNRDIFVQIHDGFAKPWYSIAFANSGEFDTIQAKVPYSLDYASDLMRQEGYQVQDRRYRYDTEEWDINITSRGNGWINILPIDILSITIMLILMPIIKRFKQ